MSGSSDYVFRFPHAPSFIQTLIDLNPVGEHVTLAWEWNSETKKPDFFVMQAIMARQECCMTQRYVVNWDNNQMPPVYDLPMQVKPLMLRACSCTLNEDHDSISGSGADLPSKQILEICTFNVHNFLLLVKKRLKSEILQTLSVKGCINSTKNTIDFYFVPLQDERPIHKEKNLFYQQLSSTLAQSSSSSSSKSPLSAFLRDQNWKEETCQEIKIHFEAEKKPVQAAITEPLINRKLCIPLFIYPYSLLDSKSSRSSESECNYSSSSASCTLCVALQSNNVEPFKLEAMDRWQRRYEEDLSLHSNPEGIDTKHQQQKWSVDPSHPVFPLSPLIVETLQSVQEDLRRSNPLIVDRVCPIMKMKQGYFDAEILLPALQQFGRDLQVTSLLGIYAFQSTRMICFAEGEIGTTRFEFESITTSDASPTLHHKTLPFLQNVSCPAPFHLEIPLRQISLFPKLCQPQSQYCNPPYVHFQVRPNSEYFQLAVKYEQREIFQLIFPYSKLQEACLTTDLSEDSAAAETVPLG